VYILQALLCKYKGNHINLNTQLYKVKCMKTILVLTDFSDNATHAAEYAFDMAKKMKADLLLCNTFLVPAEIPMSGLSVWPQEGYPVLNEESIQELNQLKKHLQDRPEVKQGSPGFDPQVNVINVDANVAEVVKGMIIKTETSPIVAGTHDKDRLSDFFIGNNVNNMIDNIVLPLLLVPPAADFKPLKKIAFATDLKLTDQDENAVYQLVTLVRPLNAEILITYVHDGKNGTFDFEKRIKELLTRISNKADYPNIYQRVINERVPERGLSLLCENGQVDMLAMVHQDHGLFKTVFGSSHTQKMSERIKIPLLVLPKQPQLV